MSPLPSWLRGALLTTAVLNVAVGMGFASGRLLPLVGIPEASHPFYPLTLGLFVALFGVGYLWAALADPPERLFIGLGGVGKLGFVVLVGCLWIAGSVPLLALIGASGDLVFAALFLGWFVASREPR